MYQYFKLEYLNKVAIVSFNRPEKSNALHEKAWEEMHTIFNALSETQEARAIILAGEGKHFCAGIDLELLMSIQLLQQIDCEGRKREVLRQRVKKLQNCINAIEQCSKPVIAAIHAGCIGGAVDIISACDMRFCTADSYFSIKEIDLGLVADIGTIQRLPKIINPSKVAEWAYTGRKIDSKEAEKTGLVNQIFEDKAAMMDHVKELASMIASKSPLVIRGIKQNLLYSRDNTVDNALNYVATWNAAHILSNDILEAFQANIEKRKPNFED